MWIFQRPLAVFVIVVLVIGAGLFVSDMIAGLRGPTMVKVTEPKLSSVASQGKATFNANCASCHGKNASGTGKGPPLVHNIYNAGHHADGAFFLAAKRGTRQHHWKFGNMPAQPQVNEGDVKTIIQYIRELQRANGIEFQPHNM
jgi:mono/diheme cytochrome c family protein